MDIPLIATIVVVDRTILLTTVLLTAILRIIHRMLGDLTAKDRG